MEPALYSQVRKGTYHIAQRVEDMNANGVLGAICFSTFPSFAGSVFLDSKDKQLARAVISTYND